MSGALDLLLEVAKATAGVLIVGGAWVGVQLLWRRAFPDTPADHDPLADRIECGSCSEQDACELSGPLHHHT